MYRFYKNNYVILKKLGNFTFSEIGSQNNFLTKKTFIGNYLGQVGKVNLSVKLENMWGKCQFKKSY